MSRCFFFLHFVPFFFLSWVFRFQVALGARLGVVSEAVAMAAVLSAASTPFHRASHMVHGDPDECNSVVGQSFVSLLWSSPLYSNPWPRDRLLSLWSGRLPQETHRVGRSVMLVRGVVF